MCLKSCKCIFDLNPFDMKSVYIPLPNKFASLKETAALSHKSFEFRNVQWVDYNYFKVSISVTYLD